ncbi:GIP, partial [Symbiodinium sp. CCMP2592]
MPPATATATPAPTPAAESSSSFQLPWQAIPRFIPGTTDVTEYSKKLQFLAAMWPKEHLSLLAPRAALMCEGTAFKKVASLDAEKLKANDETGVKLLVSTLGGSWGKTDLEKKYDSFEKAIYGTTQKADETNDSYLARHDVHFEELLAGGVTLKEIRAYILLRQSQLSSDDRKRIVVEMGGTLEYGKVSQAIRLLGSRFFTDLQGQRNSKSKTYDANHVDENIDEEPDRGVPAAAAHFTDEGEADLDNEYIEALVAAEDQDALQVQAFEEELEGFFQDTPDLQDALVNYLEARNRLLAKKRARGFWPVGAGGKGSKGGRSAKGGKGKGKNAREQLLARISRSNCRLCGERGHWKAECPKLGKGSGHAGKSEMATTTVAEVDESNFATLDEAEVQIAEVCTSLPEGALTMEVVPSAATALISHGPIEAILDTGASRCVMGKQLVLGFLSQLEEQGNRALAVRFARLNEPQLRFTMDEIRTMPLEELGRFTIDFGKAMHGRSYVDVAENEKGWCKWIIEHMGQSEKRCHQAFIAYLERYVDQAEAVESALLDTMEAVLETEPSATRGRPKAAAKSISRPPAQSSEAVPEAWDLVNQDSSDPPLDHQVTSLATRVTHMESVLQQVLMAVQDLSAHELKEACAFQAFDPQVIEEPAKQLLDQQAPLPELKKFLRSIPWDKLKTHSAGTRTGLELLETEDNKNPAYVVFGMFVHGGKVGITRVSRDFPWLTQVLVRMIKLTDPHQQVTSITISRNTRSTPHRDSFNSLAIPNIVIPFEYPRAGGEIWIAQPPAANQQSKTLMCRGQEIDGSLQSLKSAVYVNPHKWHATMPWEGNRSVAIGYAVKPVWKLEASDRAWLLRQGFALPTCNHPAFPKVASRSIANAQRVCPESALRQELDASQHMLSKSSLANLASSVDAASKSAFSVAEDISWSTFQDSLLTYGQATGPRLDVLEIYASEDSRLTTWVRSLGGKAQRFTAKDGDLTTASGQRALWDLIQKTQPQHVWCSPDCRYWGSWTNLNAARCPRYRSHVHQQREQQQVHWKLCTKICQWQHQHNRGFHLELPSGVQLLGSPELEAIQQQTRRVTIDMCVFGLQTPVSQKPIKKTTVILSNSDDLIQQLVDKQCQGRHVHQAIAGRLRELQGQTVAKFAGTYCSGFAHYVARQLLKQAAEKACAAEDVPQFTRKRFKTSTGIPAPSNILGSHKRPAAEANDDRSTAVRKLDPVLNPDVHAPSELPADVWQSIFEVASSCGHRPAAALVSPQHDLIPALQAGLPQFSIQQVFVGKGSRNLQSPLGALPPTVAPWRISLGSRVAADGTRKYFCLGNEDRTTMSAERKKLRVPVVEVSITVLGHTRDMRSRPEASISSGEKPSSEGDPKPDIEGWAPPPVPLHGPAFRSLAPEDKSRLIRIHNNLGHPSPQTLSQHLKAAKESPSLIEAALEYQCDACLESTEPRHQRPSKLPEPKEFNELVGIDGFQFKSRSGYSVNVIHVLDEASCFHLGRRINTRHGSQAIKTVSEFWTSWAGQPRKIYLDPAGEFRSEEMLSVFQGMSARVFVSAAAWQRGRVERHGDIVKDMLARMDTQAPIINDDTFDQALLQVFQAKNALVRHQGYSPEQIVLGKSVRVPGSLTSDEDLSSHAITEGLDLEAEQHRQRLELRCQARRVFWEADNNQAIRRAILRRSNPVRGPYRPGDWVLYWLRKSSPNRLAAGRWHGPAKVICQEGLSIVWVSHGTTVLRCAPENLRPASLREWQSLAPSDHEGLHKNTGGSSSFVDLTVSNAPSAESSQSTAPSAIPEVGAPQATRANAPTPTEDPIEQPEHELTPQVSQGVDDAQEQSEVERGTTGSVVPAAPSPVPAPTSPEAFEPSASEAEIPNATNIPVPGSDEGLVVEDLLLASTPLSAEPGEADELMSFLTLQAGDQSSGPPLAEDNLPYVETPLDCAEHQAFCLEIPVNAKAVKRWAQEKSPEQMVALASLSKRARAEVFVKDLSAAERELFEVAKSKEIQCWLQTSAIKPILRQKLNPEQILKSRWILTWKAPEVGEVHQRAKARLVVLGFQDPKLVDVHRDAPTLSREGRAL